jgi:CHD5-like protein
MKAELLQTSAQDQFAKWAKLRRGVDKGLSDLEKLSCVAYLHLLKCNVLNGSAI